MQLKSCTNIRQMVCGVSRYPTQKRGKGVALKFFFNAVLALLGLMFLGAALFLFISKQQPDSSGLLKSLPNLSRVIDADTLEVGSVRVRLDGISAPERGHDKYQHGKNFVALLMRESKSIECELEGRKSYDREVGKCWFIMADGVRLDPQEEAVKAGLARDCPRYSKGRYERFETPESRALPFPKYCKVR